MSDFLSQQQSDELVNGNYYNGEYQPTDQDLADSRGETMWTIKLANGENHGEFNTEQAAYEHIIACWPEWMMSEPFTIVEVKE